tara:strand:- start:24 stop:128 length:105 start_codon:yes stop_codon:yes gene_type:complete
MITLYRTTTDKIVRIIDPKTTVQPDLATVSKLNP